MSFVATIDVFMLLLLSCRPQLKYTSIASFIGSSLLETEQELALTANTELMSTNYGHH